MKAIVAVDLNWGIGYQGKLLERIPGDLNFFKKLTTGKVVIMGRETLESLPNGQPLKDRVNIVLSRNEAYHKENVITCRSLDELFQELEKYETDDVFVIGGESIYCQLIPYCTDAFVTKVRKACPADKYFINIDEDDNWLAISESDMKSYNDISYSFLRYVNNNKKESF